MRALLPRFLDLVSARFHTPGQSSDPLKLVDLGCGTGRNTVQLLQALWARGKNSEVVAPASPVEIIVGLDASAGMLEVARSATECAIREKGAEGRPEVSLGLLDLLLGGAVRTQLPPSLQGSAAGVISTLVLEHIPAKEFFEAASATMRPGAYLLVTNMHADMGVISQAGFTDPQSGVKIRPTSYCHSVPAVLAVAEEAGFQLEDIFGDEGENGVLERGVDEHLSGMLGPRAKKWIGIKVWFGICFSKRV